MKRISFNLEAAMERERLIPIEPCDSPIEDIFLWEFRKVANDKIRVRRQHECKTSASRFYLDFMLDSTLGGLQIGIECDGRDFHTASRDAQRDAAIVASCPVDKIYRLRGRDIYFRIHDVLEVLSICEPWLFSQRGLTNLNTLCSPKELREDIRGLWDSHFPYAAIRSYSAPNQEDEYNRDTSGDMLPMFPTIICWTQRTA